jgi:hypothetical protein
MVRGLNVFEDAVFALLLRGFGVVLYHGGELDNEFLI